MASNKRALYKALMKEEWNEVLSMFRDDPEIHATKIAEMNNCTLNDDQHESDTALHWAIAYMADELTVAELVFAIKRAHSSDDDVDDKASEILKSKNKRGDTPLHCAASRGSLAICQHITNVDPSLVFERNEDGETPLFLAALNGHQSTFLYLHSLCKDHDSDFKLAPLIWQRNKGDTLLHCTIRRKYFGLSYKIIQVFMDENIGSYFNEDGKLPLDEIVSIPSAFKNGIYMRWWQRLSYCFFGRKLKENHMLSDLIMDELVKQDPWYKNQDHAKEVQNIKNNKYYPEKDMEIQGGRIKKSTALLIAAKNGLTEQVKKILDDIPVSVHDQLLIEKKNIVHVAIEERQSHVLEVVKKRKHWLVLREKVDADENNALHLAAKQSKYTASGIRGPVMQMQWEIMWFQYVKECMPPYFISQRNKEGKTPGEIFTSQHMNLINECNESVKNMCGSYMVASTLVIGSAFSACFQDIHRFGQTFSISLLLSFLFSISSLATFLAIYISRKEQPKGFRRSLPLKLSLGMISFLASLISMLICFYAALSYYFQPKEKYKPMIISYVVILSPVAFLYIFSQIPLYLNLFIVVFKNVPNPRIVEEENISGFFQDSRTGQYDHNQPNVRDGERANTST